jgi:LPS O-antigen subunit length determinant protein (WzzB/FepE family)
MKKNSPLYDDEIDLGKIILDLWEGKWKIITSTIIAFIISLGFVFFKPQPSYRAITEIEPISSIDARKYNSLNSFDFFKITPQTLLNLYIEQVESKSLFIDVIKDLEIYKKSDYDTEEDYDNAILTLVSEIEVLFPNDNDNRKNEDNRKYHQILFSHTDQELWKNILTEFHKINQEFLREEFIDSFNQKILIERSKNKFDLEDIEKNINAQKIVYNLKIQNRLAFLEEQAQLARTLGIKTNTFETQNFDSKNFTITNIDTNSPFYLRGYESIEKEIALIKSRKEEKNYINELVELEQKKYLLNEDKNLERIEKLFLNTPVTQKENFVAANLNIAETKFKYDNIQNYTILIVAIFLGLFVGSFYVLISNALKNRKK